MPQFSLAHDLLTVRECVDYAARLRMDGPTPEERAENVDALLRTVGLETLSERQVRVLSGGQRRRLSLAIETVSSPSLLLCDEVTSGLDPGSAHEIMTLLHGLSREDGGARRVVINVTHSLADMELYDRVVVLSGGCLAFDAHPQHLAHYFQADAPEAIYNRLAAREPEKWQASWLKHGPHYYELEAALHPPLTTQEDVPSAEPAFADAPADEDLANPDAEIDLAVLDKADTPQEPAELSGAIVEAEGEDQSKPETTEGEPRITTPGLFTQFAAIFRAAFAVVRARPDAGRAAIGADPRFSLPRGDLRSARLAGHP